MWHLFWNILPNFLLSHTKFPGHNLSVFFCSGLSSSTSILWYCVSDGDGVESRVCCKLALSPCFPVEWRPPILPEAGWLVAVPSLPSHSFERGRCALSLLPTVCDTHRDKKPISMSWNRSFGPGDIADIGGYETQVSGHWGCTFFACFIVKFVFPNFILFFIFLHTHFGGTKPPLNILCSERVLVSLLMMRIVCP